MTLVTAGFLNILEGIGILFGAIIVGLVALVVFAAIMGTRADKKMKAAFERLAAVLGGGRTTQHQKSPFGNDMIDEVRITGQGGRYPLRLVVDDDRSNHKFRATLEAKLESSIGPRLELSYDPNAKAQAQNQLDQDGWDDNAEQTYFFTPHVYMRGPTTVLREMKARWDQLGPKSTAAFLTLMEAGSILSVSLHGTGASLTLPRDRILANSNAECLQSVVNAFVPLLDAALENWAPAASAASA